MLNSREGTSRERSCSFSSIAVCFFLFVLHYEVNAKFFSVDEGGFSDCVDFLYKRVSLRLFKTKNVVSDLLSK